ncbi:MAG: condensation domain-containing protein, partial [Myxococcota bacterium]
IGVWGELLIGGPSLARGYVGQPAETAQRFVPDPFAEVPGQRLYRTGDLCRVTGAGADVLEFGGRRDGQIKLRGFRIEIGDIEAALLSADAVAAAAVVLAQTGTGAVSGSAGSAILVAFAVAGPERDIDPAALRSHLVEHLPTYMVPARIEVLAALPLTASGKVDRRVLVERAACDLSAAADDDDAQPTTATERTLADIFAQVIGLTAVGIHTSFFELGGHSLLATQVVARIRDALAVELPLRALFEAPTVAQLADRVADARPASPPLQVEQRPASLPLSLAQERLWFIDQLRPGDPAYVIPLALRLDGELDTAALRRAVDQVIRRHEALRTTFPSVDGQPEQRIHDWLPPDVAFVDLSAHPDETRMAEATAQVHRAMRSGFDLAAGPLVRLLLVRLGDQRHLAVLTLHHIVSDGWSTAVLARELTALYAAYTSGAASPLPPLPLQYADWALHERRQFDAQTRERELDHWRQALAGIPQQLALGPPRSPQQSNPAHAPSDDAAWATHYPVALDSELTAQLDAATRERGVTLFAALLAGYAMALRAESGIDDMVVGCPVAGREHTELEPLIGFFVNTLPIRVRLGDTLTAGAVLAQVAQTVLSALAHRRVPFARIAEVAGDSRAPASLTQLWFV